MIRDFWVIDTKCKVSPNSPIPQDGSEYYYGRSVVPAESKEEAIEILSLYLENDGIYVEETLEAIRHEEGSWTDDDDHEIKDSIEDALESNQIKLGCFMSEKSKERE